MGRERLSVLESLVIPTFSHLTEFVQNRAAVANIYFGQIVNSRSESPRGLKSPGKGKTLFIDRGITHPQ